MDKDTILFLMQSLAKILDKRHNCSTFVYNPTDEDGELIGSVYLDVVLLRDVAPNLLRPSTNFEIFHDEIEELAEERKLGELVDSFYSLFVRRNNPDG